MELMEIIDKDEKIHYINPSHISAICEIDNQCKINLMGQDYMLTKKSMKEVKIQLMSFRHY
ncbi:hypothetical protein D1816_03605 [Aquimarina sp. AD10]|uniref:HTH LytTR-type domain-containing protein n=1 Tax=Aquimarina aggregata TaxID=1642818 RepID=A0A162DM71_9FLAO|nr:hypothetical protein D1816_03605 [Aquimarina sp. AD10]KZS42528.1 hypothetical protein AWE51_03545 [Aquimarina aggregata]RKN00376.1 hypothetical protein D7033_08435 [Aquimarina sp. AD10]